MPRTVSEVSRKARPSFLIYHFDCTFRADFRSSLFSLVSQDWPFGSPQVELNYVCCPNSWSFPQLSFESPCSSQQEILIRYLRVAKWIFSPISQFNLGSSRQNSLCQVSFPAYGLANALSLQSPPTAWLLTTTQTPLSLMWVCCFYAWFLFQDDRKSECSHFFR